jgi:phosphatidylglycerol---prolipoprotein diacylglyceryl transferase
MDFALCSFYNACSKAKMCGAVIPMHPILLELGPFTLYSYGLMVALGCLLGSVWIAKRAQQRGEDVDTYLQALVWIIVLGFIGARLLYVIYFPQFYFTHPASIIFDRGGLVWYGGLVTAVITALFYARVKKLSILRFADIVALPAALGLAIGRVGCFLAGCCYGKESHSPWAVQFPDTHETYPHLVHPTQLYESFALMMLIMILLQVERRSQRPGMITGLFFIGCAIIRFIIEYFRGDGIYWVGQILTASQVFSLVGVVVGLIFILQASKAKPGTQPQSLASTQP